jgi:hypothetical protein
MSMRDHQQGYIGGAPFPDDPEPSSDDVVTEMVRPARGVRGEVEMNWNEAVRTIDAIAALPPNATWPVPVSEGVRAVCVILKGWIDE